MGFFHSLGTGWERFFSAKSSKALILLVKGNKKNFFLTSSNSVDSRFLFDNYFRVVKSEFLAQKMVQKGDL
jgi:hypothetical protein